LQTKRVFDQQHYEPLNAGRLAALANVLPPLIARQGLRTALDIGCGLGFFAAYLHSLGLDVLALDGRSDNVEEARRRHPGIRFELADIEDPAVLQRGKFDLVFCFGLLYHLENPFLAVRHLHALSAKVLLVEGIVFPDERPIMALRDEGPSEDQGLRHVALYPSEACLVKLLYRSGFPFAYRFREMPEHPEYHDAPRAARSRTMLAASLSPLVDVPLDPLPEPQTVANPWETSLARAMQPLNRLSKFAKKPWPEKVAAVRRRVTR
jgi:SAM-dependent methyltransferase